MKPDAPTTPSPAARSASTGVQPVPRQGAGAGRALRAVCLVNCFDYEPYVVEAVRSALEQSVPFDEVVVVDDGSRDRSAARVREAFAGEPRVALVRQENGGQLSCFHSGLARSSGDLVFFLDADDAYEPRYLERALEVYRAHAECDALFVGHRLVGAAEGLRSVTPKDADLGFGAVLALSRSLKKLGVAPTSTLSARRPVLERFLPLPGSLVADWRTRADDVLMFGLALAAARRRTLAEPLVRYRVHGANAWYGRRHDAAYEYRRELAITRLLDHLTRYLGYGEGLANHAHHEFRTLPRPTAAQLSTYLKLAWRSDLRWGRKWTLCRSMLAHHLRSRRGGD